MSRISILLILLCGFVTGPYSHAISRVGNGYVIDEISEFVAELPKTIIESRSLPDNGIVLYLNPGLGDLLQTHEFQMNGPKVLEINTFSAKYPDLVSAWLIISFYIFIQNFSCYFKIINIWLVAP